jgi:hypothetical protein
MSKTTFGERHLVKGLDAVADAFSATVTSDVVNLKDYYGARFVVHKGVGATGTSTLTIEACDNANGDNPVAVPFFSQSHIGGDDVPADVVARSASGFTTTAGSSQLYVCEVPADKLPAGKSWVRLKSVEVVDSPVLGGILIELYGPRYAAHVPATAVA